MPRIEFTNFRISDDQRVDFDVTSDTDETQCVYFEASKPLPFDHDSIAIAASTLSGTAHDNISIDLEVSAATADAIRRFTRADVTFRSTDARAGMAWRSGHTLSFSGGFDSLAALNVMPDRPHLVSMDLGGRFARERLYFDTFDPIVISTNIVEAELHRNSWSFMGIAAILAAPYTRSAHLTFGSILEAGVDNMRVNPMTAAGGTFPPFAASGYKNAPYVSGLTEVATANILALHAPEALAASLVSLATPGEEKLYRKWLLASIALSDMGSDIVLEEPERPRYPRPYGTSFAVDFLSLYIAKRAGRDMRDRFITDVPREVEDLIDRSSFNLFERMNTTVMGRFPKHLWGGLMAKAAPAGAIPYTEDDWREYADIREVFSGAYPLITA